MLSNPVLWSLVYPENPSCSIFSQLCNDGRSLPPHYLVLIWNKRPCNLAIPYDLLSDLFVAQASYEVGIFRSWMARYSKIRLSYWASCKDNDPHIYTFTRLFMISLGHLPATGSLAHGPGTFHILMISLIWSIIKKSSPIFWHGHLCRVCITVARTVDHSLVVFKSFQSCHLEYSLHVRYETAINELFLWLFFGRVSTRYPCPEMADLGKNPRAACRITV